MTIKRLLRQITALMLCVIFTQIAFSQTKTISGKISDDKGNPIQGATVTVRGSKTGTSTDASGAFKLNVPATARTLVISSVGFTQQEVAIADKETFDVSMVASTQSLTDVVVIGYGTSRPKDVTGSISTVKAKDFNPGAISPEQLLTGKVPGLQVSNNSGQPGGTVIVKVRGNNSISSTSNPLYVVDGVPIDATSPIAPDKLGVVGTLPSSNGLLFLDPGSVRSITVLKDASASAIYGARGENGVILIETEKGNGKFQLDAGVAVKTGAGLMKSADILNAGQYRSMISQYGFKTDSGQSVNAFNDIIRNKLSTVYSLALSGGGENGKYRISLRGSDNQGNILKSGLEQYSANIAAEQSFLNKRLKLNFNVGYSNYTLQIAPIATNSGSQGNMISAAMNWNPTLALTENGLYNMSNPSGDINPLALSTYWDSYAHVQQIFANAGLALKITNHLTYNLLYGINYATSILDEQMQGLIQGTSTNYDGKGGAEVGSASLTSQTITHTLTYDQQLTNDIKLNVLAGYEYYSTTGLQAHETWGYGFNFNNSTSTTDANGHIIYTQTNLLPFKYYNAMQSMNQANLSTNSDAPSTAELQSYFARVQLGILDRYFLTGTVRDDGSNKLGVNNKYGVFPSVGFKWDILKEGFMKENKIFSNLGLRLGWGQTGGTDAIPNPGYQTSLAVLSSYGNSSGPGTSTQNFGNPNLRWETLTSTDGGIDFGILNNRVFGNIDVYSKATTNALFAGTLAVPSAGATIWQNLPGKITNKGFEIGLNGRIIDKKDLTWNFGANVSVNHNKYVAPSLGASPLFLTGGVDGQGVSSAFAQAIANGQPIDVFYLRTFEGFDQERDRNRKSQASSYVGDPNPHLILGLNTTVTYMKFGLTMSGHGQFGNEIFNNTLVSVTNLGNIANGKNISKTLIGTKESLANPVSASTRFLQSGNFFKMDNITLSYSLGNVASIVKNARIYVSGQNLFEITKYTGFDAEVNQDHNNSGVPSLGMDYIGYPTFRSVTFGINFSLY